MERLRASHRTPTLLFALSLVVYAFTAGGSLTTTDAVVTFDVTRNIVEDGSVAMSGNLLGMEAHRGRDGRYYSPFGIGQSLYNVPFYLAGRAAVEIAGVRAGKSDTIPKAVVALGQTLVAALIVFATYRLALAVTRNRIASLMAALTLAFGSVLWPYARFGFNQPLACLAILCATADAYVGVTTRSRVRVARAGFWIAAGILTRHEMALAVIPIGSWLLLAPATTSSERVRRILAFAPGVAIGVFTWMMFNAIRFGNVLDAGYLRDATPGFGSSVISGVIALLFSPSTSLLLYSPFAIVGLIGLVRRGHMPGHVAWLLGGLVVAFLLFYATLGNWLAGRSYGSRYLVVVLPFVTIGLASLLAGLDARPRRTLFGVLIGIGIVVQIPGVFLDYAKVSQTAAVDGGFSTEERQWTPAAAPLMLNARALPGRISENMDYLFARRPAPVVRAPGSDDDRGFSQQFAFSLDFWWLYLFYMGLIPLAGVWLLLALIATVIVLLMRALARSARASGDHSPA